MNPWLQRFLIAWAAGIATTGAVVSTAKQPHKLKKKRRKKREDGTPEPVQIGATALRDAKLPDERGLTMPEWRDRVVATGSAVGAKVTGVFKRAPAPMPEDGAKLPDEVQAADGTPVSKNTASAARKKRKGAHAKGRRGKKRPQATLWDSAKESFKQTVKETVREEVKETPVGNAFETLKSVGAKVKEGATKVGAGAAKAVNRAIEGNASKPDPDVLELDENGVPLPPKPVVVKPAGPSLQERLDKAGAAIEKVVKGLAEGASAPDGTVDGGRVDGAHVDGAHADGAHVDGADGAQPGEKIDVEASVKAAGQVAGEVAVDFGKKLKGGLSAVGSWLQGPGSPDYGKRRRANATGEVVEAKETASTPSAPDASAPVAPAASSAVAPAASSAPMPPASDAAPPTPPTGVPADADGETAPDAMASASDAASSDPGSDGVGEEEERAPADFDDADQGEGEGAPKGDVDDEAAQ